MNRTFYFLLMAAAVAAPALAQDRIYRCGNEYTNDAANAKQRGCKVVEGGNVTVVEGRRPATASTSGGGSSSSSGSSSPAGSPKVDTNDQRSRDSDARGILDQELKKAETRQSDLLKDYKNGEPDKIGGEAQNYQKYQDRVAEMKANIARNESDIAGIRRELGRLPAR